MKTKLLKVFLLTFAITMLFTGCSLDPADNVSIINDEINQDYFYDGSSLRYVYKAQVKNDNPVDIMFSYDVFVFNDAGVQLATFSIGGKVAANNTVDVGNYFYTDFNPANVYDSENTPANFKYSDLYVREN